MNAALRMIVGKIVACYESTRWEYTYSIYRRKYEIDSTFRFNGLGTVLYGGGDIAIGSNSNVGRYSSVCSAVETSVRIGRHCSIGSFVTIYSGNIDADQDYGEKTRFKTGDVLIGDKCWSGTKVYIGPGITIGENPAVGANSVVTRSHPPHSICAGAPACVIISKKEAA